MLKPLKIGTLNLPGNIMLAPMAGITNHVFRLLCRREGAALAFTEMVSVDGLIRDGRKTVAFLKSSAEDRPLGIQLFGSSPEQLAEAVRMVEEHGDLLDINMGCPVRKVVGSGSGSALLREPLKIAAIIRAVRAATKLPLTIKIRSGWCAGDDICSEVGKIAEAEGCDAITLHPRSRTQMFAGQADWEQIGRLAAQLSIPVIGSGDLFSAHDCLRMLKETGCAGVMIARGAMGAPWIFSQAAALASGSEPEHVSPARRGETTAAHLRMYAAECGDSVAAREMKKHIGWYVRGFSGAAEIRRLANSARSVEDLQILIETVRTTPDRHQDE